MVDQVEISNVGNFSGVYGVASELTLERLADTMDKMAKQQGADGAATVKKLKELNQELENGINVSTKYHDAISQNTEQVEENTGAVEESTDAHRTLADTMLGVFMGALGTVSGSLKGLTSELVFGGDRVSDFAQHMPMIGEVLEPVAGYLDDTFSMFRDLSKVGGTLGNDLMEFRRSTAEMYLTMEEFTTFMRDNSDRIAAYGGSVTEGVRDLRELNGALGSHREDLLNIGMTYSDMNDALSHYMYLNRVNSRTEQRERELQAEAAAEYAKTLNQLTKLTGQDVNTMRERIAEEQRDIAIQRELSKMTEGERRAWQQSYATISSISSEAGEALRQMLLGQSPLSEMSRVFASLAPEARDALQQLTNDIMSGEIDPNDAGAIRKRSLDALGDMMEGLGQSGQRLEDVLAAVSASGGEITGAPALFAELLNNLNQDMSQFFTNGVFDRKKYDELIETVNDEQKSRAETTGALAEFDQALKSLRQTIKIGIIDSGIIQSFAGGIQYISDYLNSEEFKSAFKDVVDQITNVTNAFSDLMSGDVGFGQLGDAIYDAITNDNVTKAIGIGFATALGSAAVIGGISKAIGSIFTRGTGAAGGAAGGVIGGLGQGLGKGIKGVSTGLMVAGRGAKWITLGAAAIAGAIAIIGGGIAGAAWLTGKAFPTLADGLERMSELDGERLERVGNGMKNFGLGLAAFSGGTAAKNISDTMSLVADGVYSLFGKEREDAFDKLIKFTSKEVNMDRLENNAKSLVMFTETMNRLPRPKFTEAVSEFAGSLFDGSGDLFEKLNEFSEYSIDQQSVQNLGSFTSKLERLSDIDPGNLGNYTSAIQDLVEALRELNEELKEGDVGPFGGRSGPNLGDLIQNINNTSTASSEGMDRVSTLLNELLTVIRSDTEISRKIEKNTRSIQTTNLVRNPSSF